MKKIFFVLLAAVGGWVLTGCTQNSYSEQRKQEDKLISNFIERNHINVIKLGKNDKLPDDYKWGESDYLLVPGYDNMYFHLRQRGDSMIVEGDDTIQLDAISAQETVVVRYKKFPLTENPDTLSYWSTLDQASPLEFKYLNTNSCEATGWHLAVQYMKYTNAECQIICPSKLGFTEDQNSVTPYCYIMKIKIKR